MLISLRSRIWVRHLCSDPKPSFSTICECSSADNRLHSHDSSQNEHVIAILDAFPTTEVRVVMSLISIGNL